jgi:hypothetical protein
MVFIFYGKLFWNADDADWTGLRRFLFLLKVVGYDETLALMETVSFCSGVRCKRFSVQQD